MFSFFHSGKLHSLKLILPTNQNLPINVAIYGILRQMAFQNKRLCSVIKVLKGTFFPLNFILIDFFFEPVSGVLKSVFR